MSACKAVGIKPMVLAAPATENPTSAVLAKLESMKTRPTAIACQEDALAIPLIFQLQRFGIAVPSDMSVIGYDDSRFAEDIGLTTIQQKPYDMAVSLAKKTLQLIEGNTPENRHELIAPTLILRSSTGTLKR